MLKKYSHAHDLDDPRTTLAHREIILGKPFLKKLYRDWYAVFINRSRQIHQGKYLEIGSGGGFLQQEFPEVITSDVLELPTVDRVFSAEQLPFADHELGSIMMLNVFHHIPDPHLFLLEAERTLVSGGLVLMTEPANSRLGRFIYKHFHHEPFDENGQRQIKPGNPLSNSNQALPYIYFERDRALFAQYYPQLKINSITYHSPFTYIVSGGLARSALLPGFMYGFVRAIEWLLSPLARQLGLFCTIELEKA